MIAEPQQDEEKGKNKGRPHGAHVRLLGRKFNIKLKLGDGPAQIADETSGWTTIDRPKDVAMTSWVGGQPLKMAIPIILDGWRRRESVNHKLSRLHDLVRTDDGDSRPPTFKVLGPVPFSGNRFVIESIEYGDALRAPAGTKDAGKLFRQELTLNLMQYVPPDRIKFKKRKKHHGGHHRAQEGDTAQKLANDFYGDDADVDVLEAARSIAAINDIRGIRTRIEPGRIVSVSADLDLKKNSL